jgi:hypothetical protein
VLLKEVDLERKYMCRVVFSDTERWSLASAFNEVLRGIHNVQFERVLGVKKDYAMQYDDYLREEHEPIDDDFSIEVTLPREAFVIMQRTILELFDDFGCYPGDYSARPGTELGEYLDILSGLNALLEESAQRICYAQLGRMN